MNHRRILIAAEFHFVHPVEKDSEKHDKMATQNSISFSYQKTGLQMQQKFSA